MRYQRYIKGKPRSILLSIFLGLLFFAIASRVAFDRKHSLAEREMQTMPNESGHSANAPRAVNEINLTEPHSNAAESLDNERLITERMRGVMRQISAIYKPTMDSMGISPEAAERALYLLAERSEAAHDVATLLRLAGVRSIPLIIEEEKKTVAKVDKELESLLTVSTYSSLKANVALAGERRYVLAEMSEDYELAGCPLSPGQVDQLAKIRTSIRDESEISNSAGSDDLTLAKDSKDNSGVVREAEKVLTATQLGIFKHQESKRTEALSLPRRAIIGPTH